MKILSTVHLTSSMSRDEGCLAHTRCWAAPEGWIMNWSTCRDFSELGIGGMNLAPGPRIVARRAGRWHSKTEKLKQLELIIF